ncbi:CD74 molecule, major histocompatibility complex, class II invariant chain b isoform X2 [Sardina pilchardus]|uniref:CD74 molecule, major histocompatibility complex, class II invariant chain b isoform X2 n=1 Tax=Sardina pilchardus TaxID=27697 RepID=UPI002E10CFEA
MESETPLVTTPSRDSNKKALKAAGLTLLACMLLAGQCITAYLVVGQKSELQDLNMRMHRLKELSSRSVGSGVPMKMRLPMASMPLMKLREDPADKKDDATPAPKDGSSTLTQCQQEYLGLTDSKLPSFRPQCDLAGGYLPQQCWQEVCWCVDASGKEILGTVGKPNCANGSMRIAPVATGLRLQPLVEETKDN